MLYIVHNFQQSRDLQVDKEDLRCYFVKAVNAFFLKYVEKILVNNRFFFSVAFQLLAEFIDTV